jgi:hypothetical protein
MFAKHPAFYQEGELRVVYVDFSFRTTMARLLADTRVRKVKTITKHPSSEITVIA